MVHFSPTLILRYKVSNWDCLLFLYMDLKMYGMQQRIPLIFLELFALQYKMGNNQFTNSATMGMPKYI
ncbi:hypothetical protein HR52_09330 [Aeromonas hydrophila]|nr:hypothetical protein HR52_09330 [Aeromonas hydrophila]OCA66315.1 hypothetical protein A9R12_08515 [Aeromonas hydrophila]OCY05653.1 hypothetical protein A9X69_14945 [Aeromonas hydrophila]OCY10993.1 hypothetical protein A9X70_03300 [Aeromonas hydrophila]